MLTSILLAVIVNTLAIAYLAHVVLGGAARVDLSQVARRIADEMLRDYTAGQLDRQGTEQFVRTRYMQLVARYGLPDGHGRRVAQMVVHLLEQVENEPETDVSRGFSFYS